MDDVRIGRELHSLNNMIRRYFEFSSHKQEVDRITGNNGWIIGYLSQNTEKDIYQKDIEDRFTIARSTASKVLSLMEQKGLIQRQSVAHDARLKKIVLTKKAMELQGLMKADSDRMEKLLLSGFSDDEKQMLIAFIQKMKNNISTY